MKWLQITVTTTTLGADVVAMIMWDNGSGGVTITDIHDVEEVLASKGAWDYADSSLTQMSDKRVYVGGFFAADFDLSGIYEELDQLKENAVFEVGSLESSVTEIRDSDWENEWKKYYEPIEIENVVIVPKWLSYDGKCGVQVLMDPGMAFGTGRHETTAMCVRLMQHAGIVGKTVLDIGCGSGILGITALKLGAKSSVMSDIDPKAVQSARENAALNGINSGAEFICGDLKTSGESYDIVVANITADILLRLYEKLNTVVKSGGKVIISGLIHARADEVLTAYSVGFELQERIIDGEWQAMLLMKK